MECELSIIVPVYNAVKYIARTVASLVTQKVADYEIIIVDDGSTDGSAEICDAISCKYGNVRCFHIENSGPGRARNFGIIHACGKYVAFCDSDDLPSPNMYGILLDDLKKNNVEYSMCDIFSERDGRSFGFPWRGNVRFDGRDVIGKLLASMLGNLSDNDVSQPVWGSSVRCIYVREILLRNNVLFPEDIRFAEDLVFNVRYIKSIESCYIRNEALYRYTLNPDSLMNSHVRYDERAFSQRIKLVRLISDEIGPIDVNGELIARFRTSQRCYFVEMVGNAARGIPQNGYDEALNEVRRIVNDPVVVSAFNSFDANTLKKSVSYWLVKKRCSRILLKYYSMRLN